MKSFVVSVLLFCVIIIPSFSLAAFSTSAPVDDSVYSDWDNIPVDAAAKIQRSLRNDLNKLKVSTAGIVSCVTEDGLEFQADANRARFKSSASWFALSLESFGRENLMRKSGELTVKADGAKLNLEQNGLTEWYINHGSSLEHGLLLEEKPAGDGPLQFSFAVSGNLIPEQKGKDISFTGDTTFNYSGIKAWDASGKQLACSMSVNDGRLMWAVDDCEAVYPITVDPTVSIEKKLIARTEAGADDTEASAFFGYSVSISGDFALVGAYSKDESGKAAAGAVYIFYRDEGGANNWGIVKKLIARTEAGVDDTEVNARFGGSVSVSGSVAIVGAFWKDESGKNDAGAVYVFAKDQGGENNWGIIKKLTARTDADLDDTEANVKFGYSVSLSDDLAFVGAYGKDESGKSSAGAAYMFSKNQGGADNWGIVKKLTARTDADLDDTEDSARFGQCVAVSGNSALVTAPYKKESGKASAGAAYVFSKNQGGVDNWGIVKKLTARTEADAGDTEAYAFFGWSLSLSGDVAAVGSHQKNESGVNSAGAVYVFYTDQGGADNWGIVKKLTARTDADGDDKETSAYFGYSTSISGDLILIGARSKDESGKNDAGAAYIFCKDEGGANNWGIVNKVTARTDAGGDDTEADAEFGYSVALSGELALVGAGEKNESGNAGAGAVYVYSIVTNCDKVIVPAPVQPSGTTVVINSNEKLVRTDAEVKEQYNAVSMNNMLGSQIYEFTATVTYNKLAYFCFNSSSLGERKANSVALFKLFKDKENKRFAYSLSKNPSEEGYFWITDEANSGQYIHPETILTGGQVYTVNYSVKDNGEYDLNSTVGRITDPVVPGISSGGSGCVLNPNAEISVELAVLLLVALAGICLRLRRRS